MKKFIYLLIFLIFIFASSAHAANIYGCTSLTGGGAGALDALDITGATTPNADNLADGDGAMVYVIAGAVTTLYEYVFDADATTAESSPTAIRPDDYATAGVWVLVKLSPASIELGHLTDTTIARSGAGDATIEGNQIYRAGGTDVADGDVADDITITAGSQIQGGAPTFTTLNTGQGAYELYAMDQDVETTDDVTFDDVTVSGTGTGLKVGNGTPTQTMNGEDAYIEGFLEVDGSIFADGGIISATSTDPYLTFDVTDADDTDWTLGTNADAGASSDDFLELRQSSTVANKLSYTFDPATGDVRYYGVAGGTGGDNAFYTLWDVVNPTANRTIAVPDANVTLANIAVNTTHKSSDGSDHTFIDQSVVSGATPTFTGTNITAAATATALVANGANCAAGEIALGVDASGAVEGCYEPSEADISDLAHTATAITDNLIVEADLNADEVPADNDLLTFDTTGANFSWQTPAELSLYYVGGTDVADADVADDITVSNYLLLAGGTLTGEVVVDNLGLEFTAGDDHANCAAFSATGGGIFFDDSEGIFKKCQDNVLTDLDTTGGTPATADISDVSVTQTELAELETIGATTISANQWAALGGIAETLAAAELNLLDGETDLANQAELDAVAALVDTDDEIIAIINASPATQIGVPGGGTGAGTFIDGGILLGSGTGAFTALGAATNGQIPIGDGTTDPVLATITGTASEITVTNGAGTITLSLPNDAGTDISADLEEEVAAGSLADNSVYSADINTIVESIYWPAAAISADGTQCADPTQAVINSGPEIYTIICADNDASQIEGHIITPDSWDAGNLTFELEYLQTAADTAALEWDIYVQCRGPGETVNNTWETAVNVIDAAVTGSNGVDHTTSGNVTCASDAAGDTLYWRIEIDAAGTATAMATLHILGVKVEYTSNVGD